MSKFNEFQLATNRVPRICWWEETVICKGETWSWTSNQGWKVDNRIRIYSLQYCKIYIEFFNNISGILMKGACICT